MSIHDADILSLNALEPGDIIIDYDGGPEHALMWVGGERPLVHCADSEKTSGVLQQKNKVYEEDGDDAIAEVYRCPIAGVAARAAIIAQRFAVPSNDPAYILAKQTGAVYPLRTRYSQNRLGGNGGIWGPEAFVRAVRAYYRSRIPARVLSANEGVTCSQFITYTYQAACIHHHTSHSMAVTNLIQQAALDGLLGNLHIHGLAPLEGMCSVARSYTALRPIRQIVENAIVASMKLNACITSVDVLTARLRGAGGGAFAHVGNLAGQGDD